MNKDYRKESDRDYFRSSDFQEPEKGIFWKFVFLCAFAWLVVLVIVGFAS